MTPLKKTTDVPLTPQEAFDLFMAQLDAWWPKDRHAAGPESLLEVEARKNGEIVEVRLDGTRKLWGRIIGWDPARYMAFTWCPDCPEEEATVVAVSFTPTEDGTRVDLTLGDQAILGDVADAVSTSYLFGWDLVLGSYCFAASRFKVMA